jgi:hypothetical protein
MAVPVGTDVRYDGASKTISHWQCDTVETSESAEAIAERPHFIPAERIGEDLVPKEWKNDEKTTE